MFWLHPACLCLADHQHPCTVIKSLRSVLPAPQGISLVCWLVMFCSIGCTLHTLTLRKPLLLCRGMAPHFHDMIGLYQLALSNSGLVATHEDPDSHEYLPDEFGVFA